MSFVDLHSELSLFLEAQACDGTLQALQRAVLDKALASHRSAGHFPVSDMPGALLSAFSASPSDQLGLGGACVLFYAFADVTDDAQDKDLQPDPWLRWGWEQAVNTGFSLLFLCLRWIRERCPSHAAGMLASLFSEAGLSMTHGQHLDLMGQSVDSPRLDRYLKTIELKSGASFGAYARAASMIGARDEDDCKAFYQFGKALGMMFQMMNDTHELWRNELSSDFRNGRLTLPLVLALEQGRDEGLMELLEGDRTLERQHDLVQCLEAKGIRANATMRIELLRREAMQLASRLGVRDEPYLSFLLGMPAFPIDRVIA
ncbi:MAG TPA: polyprenyl synthetase family protein [Pantanalinema sp.]